MLFLESSLSVSSIRRQAAGDKVGDVAGSLHHCDLCACCVGDVTVHKLMFVVFVVGSLPIILASC